MRDESALCAGKIVDYGTGGWVSESGLGCWARFRFFLLRSRACSSVHNVTTIAMASGTRILRATRRYSFELMDALCVPGDKLVSTREMIAVPDEQLGWRLRCFVETAILEEVA